MSTEESLAPDRPAGSGPAAAPPAATPAPTTTPPPAAPQGSLRSAPFLRLWGGTAASNLADGVLLAAAPLLAAALTRDPTLVAGTLVAQKLPWFLFSLLSGVVVDRVPHRVLLFLANGLRALALLGLCVGLWAGVESLALLYLTLFLLGTAETVVDTAALAILPTVLAKDRLEDGNGRIYSTQAVLNELVGPPLGSALFALAAVASFVAGGAGFALAALLFLGLPRAADATPRITEPFSGRQLLTEIGEGLRWFLGDRMIRTAAVMAAVANIFSSATLGVLVLYAQDELGVGAAGYGWLLTGEAVGGVLGGVVAGTMVRRLGAGVVVFVSNALPAVGYATLFLADGYAVAWVALAVSAFAVVLGNVVVITLRQTGVPASLVGRVTSSYRLVALGAVPLGALLGGVMASAYGVRSPFLAGAVCLLVLAVAVAPVMTTRNLVAAGTCRERSLDDTDRDGTS